MDYQAPPSHLPLPYDREIMHCVVEAARTYQVPRILVLAIIRDESSGNRNALRINRRIDKKTGQVKETKDVGLMQINTVWHKELANKYGIANVEHYITHDACYNIKVGTWILSNEIVEALKDGNSFWVGVGNYHSNTPSLNESYQRKIANHIQWLTRHTNWSAY